MLNLMRLLWSLLVEPGEWLQMRRYVLAIAEACEQQRLEEESQRLQAELEAEVAQRKSQRTMWGD